MEKYIERVRALIHERTGLHIRDWDLDRVEEAAKGIAPGGEIRDLYRALEHEKNFDERFWPEMLHAITRPVSNFARQLRQIKLLRELVETRGLSQGRQEPLKLWSAACATGEEPVAIAMALYDLLEPGGFDFHITATDIDPTALEMAGSGVFSRRRIGHLPDEWQEKFFTAAGNGDEGMKISSAIGNKITWELVNLMDTERVGELAKCNVIFCRNVLCYFSDEAIHRFLTTLGEAMHPGAFLITDGGDHFESLISQINIFRRQDIDRASVWMKLILNHDEQKR